jgi:transcriptional regulator with XRE-family HTH domain
MSTIVNDLDIRLARRIKTERESRGWSLAELAGNAQVSKAMISKIERGEASPTAALLGRLSGAFGLSLSTLLSLAEGSTGRLVRRADQQRWQDPATGFRRRAVSPPGSRVLELIEGELPPRARIAYPAAAYAFLHQQIWVLAGRLTFHEGGEVHDLDGGDCIELGAPAECVFENRGKVACRYLVAIAKRPH